MKNTDREIVMQLKRRIPNDLAMVVKKIIVFGSRARGEGMADSDLDLAVLVANKTPEIETKLEDIAYQVMWDHDFKPIISLKVFSESHFFNMATKGYSFYKHVQNQGVSV